jgi:hypothetical protein
MYSRFILYLSSLLTLSIGLSIGCQTKPKTKPKTKTSSKASSTPMARSQKNIETPPRVVKAPLERAKINQLEGASTAQSTPQVKPSVPPTASAPPPSAPPPATTSAPPPATASAPPPATPSKPSPTFKDLPTPPPFSPEVKTARQNAKARTFAKKVLSELPKTQLKMRTLSLTLKTAQRAISAKTKPSGDALQQLRARLDIALTEAEALNLTTSPTGPMVKHLNVALAETVNRKEVRLKERIEEGIKMVQKLNPVIIMLKKRILSAREVLNKG